ncbi:MAG: sigma-70 family RNA polymerase sigma factor [Acidobacteriota bacterium]
MDEKRSTEQHSRADLSVDEGLAEAVRKARAGVDAESCFREIDQRLRPRLLQYFRRHGSAMEDAEDLVQTTLSRVYLGVRQLEQEDRFLPWLFTIARNVRMTAHARAGGVEAAGDGGDCVERLADTRPSPDADALAKDLLEPLWRAIEELPDQQRQCVVLRVKEEMSYDEIAATLRLSAHTVRNHLAQAKKSLRRVLSYQPEGEL